MSHRLYVRGVSERMGQKELVDVFSKYGHVVGVQTGQAGFAFVDMQTEKDAEAAMNALDGSELDGQKLLVEKARGVERGRGPPLEKDFRCFNCNQPGHLARDCTEKPRNPLYADTRGTKIADLREGRVAGPQRFHPYQRPPHRDAREHRPPYNERPPPRYDPPPSYSERRPDPYPPRRERTPPDMYKPHGLPPRRSPERERRTLSEFPPDSLRSRNSYFDRRMDRERPGMDGMGYHRRSPEPRDFERGRGDFQYHGDRGNRGDPRSMQEHPYRPRSPPMRSRTPPSPSHYRMREPPPPPREVRSRSPPPSFYHSEPNGERFMPRMEHDFNRSRNRSPERYRGRYKPMRNPMEYRSRSPHYSGGPSEFRPAPEDMFGSSRAMATDKPVGSSGGRT